MNKQELRNYWLTIAGKGVSLAGSSLFGFAMSLYVLQLTGSATNFAISLILSTLPRVLLSPFVGILADRRSKKTMVVASDLMSGSLMFLVLLIAGSSEISLLMVYAAQVSLSISLVFLETAFSASNANIVSRENLLKLNSMNQTVSAIVQVLAPVIGGLLFVAVDIKLFILINGISFLLSAFSECFIDFSMFSQAKGGGSGKMDMMADFKEGFAYLGQKPVMISIMVYALLINFFAGAFSVIFPFDVVQTLKIDAKGLGIIEAGFPIGAIIMSIVIGKRNMKFTQGLFRNCILAMGLGMFLFVVPVLPVVSLGGFNVPYYVVAMMMTSAIMVAVNVPLSTFMQLYVDEAYRGRLMGLLGTGATAIMPLAYIVTGFTLGLVPSYLITGAVGIAITLTALHIHYNPYLKSELSAAHEGFKTPVQAE